MLRPRLATRRLGRCTASIGRPSNQRAFADHAKLTTTKPRPSLPFLYAPSSNPNLVRYFTSTRGQWLRHEARLVARYTLTFWGLAAAVLVMSFAVNEEVVERRFPTPHEWTFLTRKYLRDANSFKEPKNGNIEWTKALELARSVVARLEGAKDGGADVRKLQEFVDITADAEFAPCDISAKSEEWRRGYYEAIMLAAKASEHVDGWLRDVKRNVVSAPEFVIGPSNPRPTPIPAGSPHAPWEEDCELAFPPADNWYVKILSTAGFSSRQRIQAALEYASFMEFKGRADEADALYTMALVESTKDLDASKMPYDAKTLVLQDRAGPPSLNVLDAVTAVANSKARRGDISAALPMYISILKARRSLSDERPPQTSTKPKSIPLYQLVINVFLPPEYPAAPPDGTQPPWRSAEEQCQEASLHLYIGEILYAKASRDDGLSWTRDGVDLAEEQLRTLGAGSKDKATQQTCRECLGTGLGNWSTMVSRLAKAERAKKDGSSGKPGMFSFWSGTQQTDGRWEAEEAVVQERMRRTRELMEDIAPPPSSIVSWFKA